MPASSAAAENVRQDGVTSSAGVTPGSMNELPAGSVTDAPKRLLLVTRLRILAAAALKALCPRFRGRGLHDECRRHRSGARDQQLGADAPFS
jgi:hypothetical protein